MTAPIPFDAEPLPLRRAALFRPHRLCAAPHRARWSQTWRSTADDRVMDLGCGPGLLAIAFAPLSVKVVAVDPSADMLAVGRDARPAALAGKIRFVEGSSNDLGDRVRPLPAGHHGPLVPLDGPRRHAAPARRASSSRTVPSPCSTSRRCSEGAATGTARFEEIVERHAPDTPFWRSPDWVDQSAILIDSAFSRSTASPWSSVSPSRPRSSSTAPCRCRAPRPMRSARPSGGARRRHRRPSPRRRRVDGMLERNP